MVMNVTVDHRLLSCVHAFIIQLQIKSMLLKWNSHHASCRIPRKSHLLSLPCNYLFLCFNLPEIVG